MPLQKTSGDISLTGGIDRKTDPKQLKNGQMYTADNVQYVTEKQIRKRYGFTSLTPPGGLQGAPFAAVGCRDNIEPLVLGTGSLNRYNPVTNLSTSIPANTQGRLSAVNITASSGIGSAPCPPVNSSCATDGQKYTLVTWEEIDGPTANLFYGVQDLSTGSWIISPQLVPQSIGKTFVGGDSVTYTVTAQFGPRAFYLGQYFYILLEFTGSATVNSATVYGSTIQAYALDLTNLAGGLLGTNLIVKFTANAPAPQIASAPTIGWDATLTNGSLYVAYFNPNQAGSGYVQQFSINGVTFASTAYGIFTGATPISSTYQRLSIAVGSNSAVPVAITTNSSLILMTSNLTTSKRLDFSNPQTDTQTAYPTATLWVGNTAFGFSMGTRTGLRNLYMFVNGVNATTGNTVFYASFTGPSTSVATGIVSRPWSYNNRMYIWVFGSGYAGWGVFREQVLCEIDIGSAALQYVARTGYQNAGLVNQPYNMVPSDVVQVPGTGQYLSYLTQTTDVVGGKPATLGTDADKAVPAVISNSFYGVLTRTQFDFKPATPSSIVTLPTGGVLITGAIPLQYDGQALVEAGFSSAPELTTAPLLPGTGIGGTSATADEGQVAAGTYTYYTCFCRRDAYGNIIRSSPSAPYIVTLTNPTNIVVFPVIYYSNVPGAYIEYYRTTLTNPDEPQLVAKVPNGTSFIDTHADADLKNNPTLYTYSGEYPNDPPPAIHSIAFGETRAYLIPSDARNSLWCSKKYSPGHSVEWSTNLILTEGGTNNGQFTAVAVLDSNVIVFKRDQIIYFTGDGPDNAGATGSFTSFQKLSSDVGCIDPGSLAVIPNGLLFRSQRGIELLSRGLQVSYVGFPVEPLVQSLTTIASAVVMPKYQQVRFVPSTPGQPVLVYDYLGNRWSTYSNMASVSAANVMGNYWWISTDGTKCNVETPGAFLDAGSDFIPMTLETPEIPMNGPQGWGRLYRFSLLGEYKSPHTLSVSFAYDHAETYSDVVTYSALDANALDPTVTDAVYYDGHSNKKADVVTPPCAEQFRMSRVPRQVMQTVRFMLQDAPFSGYYMSDGAQVSANLLFGEGCAISNITLEVGQKAIIAKLPGNKTV